MQQDYLDRLVAQARRFLLRWRLRRELRLAGAVALAWLFVLPLLLLLVRWAGALAQVPQPPVNGWLVAGLALLGPLLYVLGRAAWVYARYRPGRHTGLALFDAQLDSKDRLVTADEFIAAGANSGFMRAAVEDAEQYVNRALQTSLAELPMPQWRVRPLAWAGVPALAVVALLLALGIGGLGDEGLVDDAGDTRIAAVEADAASTTDGPQRLAQRREPRRTQEPMQEPVLTERQQEAAAASRQRPRNEEAAEGQSNAGSASAAQSSSTSSSAAGQPSSQKNASRPKEEEEPTEEEKRRDAAAKKREQRPQQETQMAMEASTGQGKSGGSSSSLSEFDLPEQPDKAGMGIREDDQNEETEDEDEEEKSNSVAKPDLRDRKAPVDRNAGTSPTGTEPRDDDNGRGGPGGRKKTRGVPSMILGVPIADRVQGRPSPGRSKVTQENAKPTAESHPALTAEERLARVDAAGHVEHQLLLPWMQNLIRNYFTSVHEQAAALPPPDPAL